MLSYQYLLYFFFLMIPPPPKTTLFPYTTLFRSPKKCSGKNARTGRTIIPVTAPVTYKLTTDRKSTRLNSSHVAISYAVFCLKKKKKNNTTTPDIKVEEKVEEE